MPPAVIDTRLSDDLAGINFAYGRGECPYPIDVVVIHVSEGDAASVRAWFNDPDAKVSAHYLVRKDGRIEQYVSEEDKAFHAGQLVAPTAPLVLERFANGRWTPNSYGIGIEHEGSGREELTPIQRAASYQLIADIATRRGIPVDPLHIIPHRTIKASKTCPGAIDTSRIIRDVAAMVATPVANAEDYPRVVWSNFLRDWLAVVQYTSDTDWRYARFSNLATIKGERATTPLSQMPRHPSEAE